MGTYNIVVRQGAKQWLPFIKPCVNPDDGDDDDEKKEGKMVPQELDGSSAPPTSPVKDDVIVLCEDAYKGIELV